MFRRFRVFFAEAAESLVMVVNIGEPNFVLNHSIVSVEEGMACKEAHRSADTRMRELAKVTPDFWIRTRKK